MLQHNVGLSPFCQRGHNPVMNIMNADLQLWRVRMQANQSTQILIYLCPILNKKTTLHYITSVNIVLDNDHLCP